LEERVFDMTGLAMATHDADEADDNMSTNPEEEKEEQLQLACKKLIHRLRNVSARTHGRIYISRCICSNYFIKYMSQ
jgi:hypothetical protein